MTSEEPSEQDERVTVAAFDFDGTITRGGSTFQFLIQVRGLLPVAAATIRMLPKILHAGIVGGTAADDTKELLFIKLFGGQSADRVQRAGRHFAEGHIRRRLRPEVRTRIEWHRQQGHKVLLVSASVEQYVVPAGDLLGVDAVLATRLAVGGSGLLTGGYEGKNCRGTEKYARVLGWMRSQELPGSGPNQPILWAYGNSRSDEWLLSSADHGINASRLGRFSRLARFPRLASMEPRATHTP